MFLYYSSSKPLSLALRLHPLPQRTQLLQAARPLFVAFGQTDQSANEAHAALAELRLLRAARQHCQHVVLLRLLALRCLRVGEQVLVGKEEAAELGLDGEG